MSDISKNIDDLFIAELNVKIELLKLNADINELILKVNDLAIVCNHLIMIESGGGEDQVF